MTREEAIPILKELEGYYEDLIKANPAFLDKERAEKDLEAIRYGRNSLEVDEQYQIEYEHENAELCEDYISRKNTLEEFKRVYFDNDAVIRCAELILGGMPSVTPKPKTGRWMPVYKSTGTIIAVRCECCGFSPRNIQKTYYCPNCGAKMESEDKE